MRLSELITRLEIERLQKGDAVVNVCIDGARWSPDGSGQISTTGVDMEWDGDTFLLTVSED